MKDFFTKIKLNYMWRKTEKAKQKLKKLGKILLDTEGDSKWL